MSTDMVRRARPGEDGAIYANTPDVEAVLETGNITLDVHAHVDWLALFAAITTDEHLTWCLQVLRHNRSESFRLLAARELELDVRIKQAMTITFGPSQAEDVARALSDAVDELARDAADTTPDFGDRR